MSFKELLEWSGGRSDWQQDTLRRIALEGQITADDIVEIRRQIEQKAGLPVENAVVSVKLEEQHLSNNDDGQEKTVLGALGPVKHIDRLAEEQPPLQFIDNGVTLVYGANASGKSGYCRITKQLCRSMSPVDLRGNVYEAENENQPIVSLVFREGDDPANKVQTQWENGSPCPAELARISVFDTASARIYVDKKRKIEFLPYELDLMNKLGLTCLALDKEFLQKETELNAGIAVPLPSNFTDGTEVQQTLAKLVSETELEQLPAAAVIEALGDWTDGKQTELESIISALEGDPKVQAQLCKNAKSALEIVRRNILDIVAVAGDDAVIALLKSRTDANAKSKAAQDAAKELFEQQPISDIGSDTWRQMLIYAREFADTVYNDREPPQIATGDKCVLCQQDLADEAKERLKSFDEFIVGRAAEDSEVAKQDHINLRNGILDSQVMPKEQCETILASYTVLGDATAANVVIIIEFADKLRRRLAAVQEALRQDDWEALEKLDPLEGSPVPMIDAEINRLIEEIERLEKTDRDEDALDQLKKRLAELADQKTLSEIVAVVVERRNKLEERCRILTCRKECGSNAITRRITSRRRQIMTPTLKNSLHTELINLKLTHIPINLTDRGEGTDSIVEIALSAQQQVNNNSEILSEGEQRALALACFLAELEEIGNTHGIIVDDPVSSLDQSRMEAVAKRLALEAKKGRQVIIFTHNIVFHYLMVYEAQRAQVAHHTEWMSSRGNEQFGIIDETNKPWHVKKVKDRLKEITVELNDIKNSDYDAKNNDYRPVVINLYTKMRETWERMIEEVLMNEVIQRFQPAVQTMRLRAACIDPASDYPIIFEGMKQCSHYSGHDRAEDLPSELPEIGAMENDLSNLQGFYETANQRRKGLEKDVDRENTVAPVFV